MRYGVYAVSVFLLLPLAVAGTGCAPSEQPNVDRAQQQWDDTARRCRGELLLVKTPPDDHAPQSAAADRTGDAVPSSTIADARRYTVAVRASVRPELPQLASLPSSPRLVVQASGLQPGLRQGTGVIIDDRDGRGWILTNEHVVGGCARVEIRLADGGWVIAAVAGVDPGSDLAILRIDRKPPAAARFGDAAAVRIGEPVAAIGYPAGRSADDGTLALTGSINALGRSLQGALDPTQEHFYGNLLESTIPIPPGCSGGPLLDAAGCVIGINTAVALDARTGRSFGYAIPISARVRAIVDRLCRAEPVEHGYIGLLVRAERAGRPLVVEQVVANGPASRAGIRRGDVITHVGGSAVGAAGEFAERIRAACPGEPIEITVLRDNSAHAATLTPTTRPPRAQRRG